MYAAFNLCINDYLKYEQYRQKGEAIYANHKRVVEAKLKDYLVNKEWLNGDRIMEDWFPSVEADIFISHSHKNQDLALKLAGWLKTSFDLDCFVDCCIWNSADSLLKTIDNTYCLCDDGLHYDYQNRNFSTSHVHMMLASSIMKMMDKTEAVFFLNTPDLMTIDDCLKYPYTYSPWIYAEYTYSKHLHRKLNKNRRQNKRWGLDMLLEGRGAGELAIGYGLDLSQFPEIDDYDLNLWKKKYGNNNHFGESPLDTLYKMKNVIKKVTRNNTKCPIS